MKKYILALSSVFLVGMASAATTTVRSMRGVGISQVEQQLAVIVVNGQIGALAEQIGISFVPSDGLDVLIERTQKAIDSAVDDDKPKTTDIGSRLQLYFEWYIILSRGIDSREWAEVVTKRGITAASEVSSPMMASGLYHQTQDEIVVLEGEVTPLWVELDKKQAAFPETFFERLTRTGFVLTAREKGSLPSEVCTLADRVAIKLQMLMAGMAVSNCLRLLVEERDKPLLAAGMALHVGAGMMYKEQMASVGIFDASTNIHRSFHNRSVSWTVEEKECVQSSGIEGLSACLLAQQKEILADLCMKILGKHHWLVHKQQQQLYQLDLKIAALNAYKTAKDDIVRDRVAMASHLGEVLSGDKK